MEDQYSKNGAPEVNTFTPSLIDLEHFETFLFDIEKKGGDEAGIMRLIPPNEWIENLQLKTQDEYMAYLIEKMANKKNVATKRICQKVYPNYQTVRGTKQSKLAYCVETTIPSVGKTLRTIEKWLRRGDGEIPMTLREAENAFWVYMDERKKTKKKIIYLAGMKTSLFKKK